MRQSKQYGDAAFALGIVSIPALFVFFIGMPLGVAAIVTGAIAVVRERSWYGRAIAGMAFGAIALVGAVVLIIRPDS